MPAQEFDKSAAIISPGQGSQKVGMGLELAQLSQAAAKVWKDANAALFPGMGFKFTDLVWHGTLEELTKTEHAQPAIIVNALAHAAAMKEGRLLDNPYWKTGHSVGFIVPLVLAGVLDTQVAVQLGEARGRAFKYAVENGPKTTMMAVMHDKQPEIVAQIVEDFKPRFSLYEALLNTDYQVVLAGRVEDIKAAAKDLQRRDPKLAEFLRILNVDAAFHTPFMKPAVPIYGEAVDKISMNVPEGGLIAGSTVKPLTAVDMIKEALVAQLTHTERWRDVVRFLGSQSVTKMIELDSSAPTLSDMNRRILGGRREKILLSRVDGGEIVVGWRWHAPQKEVIEVKPEEAVVKTKGVVDEEFEKQDVAELLEAYGRIDEMIDFLEFSETRKPKSNAGIELWYRKWCAIRKVVDIEEIGPDAHFIDDLEIDCMDLITLRTDVFGTFGRLVSDEEAANNVTCRMAAQASWRLLNES